MIVAMVLGVSFFAILVVGMLALVFGFGGFPGDVIFPFCGIIAFFIVVLIVFGVLTATGVLERRNLPPPPPIQQPMVPAGTQGPVALSCPNCGAPPQNVDRFGVATCTYCGTRFLVR